jgi:hypothetical protein
MIGGMGMLIFSRRKIMKKFMKIFVFTLGVLFIGDIVVNPNVVVANDVDKILKAKEMVRKMVNYPDTLVFHEFSTKVSGNTVTLKFTCKNGFGVPETHTIDIKVK